jgi:hypothetical protein
MNARNTLCPMCNIRMKPIRRRFDYHAFNHARLTSLDIYANPLAFWFYYSTDFECPNCTVIVNRANENDYTGYTESKYIGEK